MKNMKRIVVLSLLLIISGCSYKQYGEFASGEFIKASIRRSDLCAVNLVFYDSYIQKHRVFKATLDPEDCKQLPEIYGKK